MSGNIKEIKKFTRELGHSYNNALFKIRAFAEIFDYCIDDDPETLKTHIDKLKNAADDIEKYNIKLSKFAHTGEIEV